MPERPTGTPRLLTTALATSTLPLLVLGAPAMAAPAAADVPRHALMPRTATPVNVQAAQARLGSTSLASSLPAAFVGQAAATPAAKPPATYTVKAGDTLSHIAERHGMGLSVLLKANGMTTSSVIHPGQKLKLSGAATSSGRSTGAKAPASRSAATYTVKAGDTLSGIAARHGMGLSVLLKANGMTTSSVIHPGQKLKLSGAATSSGRSTGAKAPASRSAATYTVKAGDTLSHIAERHGMGLSVLLKANGMTTSSVIHPGQKLKLSGAATSSGRSTGAKAPASRSAATYTVKAGDTLSGIAARHGMGLSVLLKANGMTTSSVIHPGQKLKLSGAARGAASQGDLVPSTFLHYTYPDHVVSSANVNKRALLKAGVPSRSQMQSIIADTARRMGVDPSLALAHAFTESGFNHASVSPANAIGAMQVIPASGRWASELVGRDLNLLDPNDNATAGVAIIRQLQRTAPSVEVGIAAYYQGLGGVTRNGMYPDTRDYVAKVKGYMRRF
ncbi:LysM peptidoglycan-binding domain-containing protein [Citricoccus sp. SGAir0253]|uniref:lytic transglycosylase domain-containing protein n=1 Tax=Citricoccus sp. SGAir0253 TaxID=2567881 RepID=UPI0010CD6BC8|nr:lytic transglycosylase domain-containing protein [Citricoccus sp. SGAir0253]QCU77827.1 LysM peptidoglycan-binding domain-containing protein [Citricoccus sp. SGAir0253]